MNDERNMIHYYAEPVKEGYSIVHRDVVMDGEVVESIDTGSPGPTPTVEEYIRRNHGSEGKVYL